MSTEASEASAARSAVEPDVSRQRSAVTNGTVFLPGVNGNSTWVRRARDLNELLIIDRGGDDQASEAEKLIIRRAAVIATECERMEAKFATAGQASDVELDGYQRASNSLRRLLESVGLERRAKDVPSLQSYLRDRGSAQ